MLGASIGPIDESGDLTVGNVSKTLESTGCRLGEVLIASLTAIGLDFEGLTVVNGHSGSFHT